MTELRRIRTRKQNYILAITAHSQLQLAQKTTIRLPFSRFRTISHALLLPNAVGYENLNWMAADYYMMGAQFENTSGGDLHLEDIDFGDLATTAPYFDYDGEYKKTAVQVQIANADSEGAHSFYFIADGNYDESSGIGTPAWVDEDGFYANPTVAAGIGYWFRDQLSAQPKVQTAGQIVPDSPWEKTFDTHYRFLVNPFPVAWDLESVDFGEIEQDAPYFDYEDAYKNTATQIQVPNANKEGFLTYYFLADGNWDDDKGVGTPGWVDGAGVYANPTVPMGRGCWFRPLPAGKGLTVNFYINGKPAKE